MGSAKGGCCTEYVGTGMKYADYCLYIPFPYITYMDRGILQVSRTMICLLFNVPLIQCHTSRKYHMIHENNRFTFNFFRNEDNKVTAWQ